CGEHHPDCICPIPCGSTCCKQGTTESEDEVCIDDVCKPPCKVAGTHYEGQTCVCDDGRATCGFSSPQCCAGGFVCQGARCVPEGSRSPRGPNDPAGTPLQNFLNMITQAGGAQGGPGTRSPLALGATRGGREPVARPAEALLGPIGSALLEL